MTDPSDYLAAYRRSIAAPAGVRDGNLQAIRERAERIDAQAEPKRARWAASALVIKITTAVVLTAGVGWGAARAFSTPEMQAAGPDVVDNAEAPVVSPTPATPGTPPPATARPRTPSPPPIAPVRATAVQAPTKTSPRPADAATDRLREEVALLESARAHLDAGRLDEARAALRRHSRQFPQGTLAEERSAWSAIVSCSSGGTQPKAAARSFLLTHAGTPLGARVKAECGLWWFARFRPTEPRASQEEQT